MFSWGGGGGGSRLSGQNCQGSPLFGYFYCIFINKIFENLQGGPIPMLYPPSPLTPLCASMDLREDVKLWNFNFEKKYKSVNIEPEVA
jgi:hypothetical protein